MSWHLLHAITLLLNTAAVLLLMLLRIVGADVWDWVAILTGVSLIVQGMHSLLYIRYGLLPIAYPALYRKADDE